MAEPTLYLFDGYNLLHAGGFQEVRQLVDRLASFVALRGARGIVVFDGAGDEVGCGPLEVRYAPHADALLERLAAEHRGREEVCLVSSDTAVRVASGREVRTVSSRAFVRELAGASAQLRPPRTPLWDRLDEATRTRLERMRRGQEH